jgi:hypothetical protein
VDIAQAELLARFYQQHCMSQQALIADHIGDISTLTLAAGQL